MKKRECVIEIITQ